MFLASLVLPAVLYSAAGAADIATTEIATRRAYVTEGNTLSPTVGSRITPHAGAAVALAYLDSRIKPTAGKWVLRGAVILGTGLICRHNLRAGR